MNKIYDERMTAEFEGDFVVFLIGMRINNFWKIHKWLPVALAMPKMLQELYKNPELGFLSHESWFGRTTIMVQYWKSFEQLESYARNKSLAHLPAWVDFNKKVANNSDVGIWHETYVIHPGNYESIYSNMPKFGLAKVAKHISASGKLKTAKSRMEKDKSEV